MQLWPDRCTRSGLFLCSGRIVASVEVQVGGSWLPARSESHCINDAAVQGQSDRVPGVAMGLRGKLGPSVGCLPYLSSVRKIWLNLAQSAQSGSILAYFRTRRINGLSLLGLMRKGLFYLDTVEVRDSSSLEPTILFNLQGASRVLACALGIVQRQQILGIKLLAGRLAAAKPCQITWPRSPVLSVHENHMNIELCGTVIPGAG